MGFIIGFDESQCEKMLGKYILRFFSSEEYWNIVNEYSIRWMSIRFAFGTSTAQIAHIWQCMKRQLYSHRLEFNTRPESVSVLTLCFQLFHCLCAMPRLRNTQVEVYFDSMHQSALYINELTHEVNSIFRRPDKCNLSSFCVLRFAWMARYHKATVFWHMHRNIYTYIVTFAIDSFYDLLKMKRMKCTVRWHVLLVVNF